MASQKHYDLFFLNDYFDNDLSAILPILEMYLEETPKELAAIENCLIKNDAATSKAITHKIKTNISMLGIHDQSTFINDMYLLHPSDDIQDAVKQQFDLFKASVTQAFNEIREDIFSDRNNGAEGS